VRIRIALSTTFAVTCMITAFLISLGSTSSASAPTVPVAAASSDVPPASSADVASLAVPVLAHTALGFVIAVGDDGQFPTGVPVPGAAPPVAPVVDTDANSVDTPDWQCIRVHESGDNYNDPNMPSGAYGILISTWQSFGYSGWPYQAAPATQDALALRLHSEYGFDPWSSRYACGL
jgi:Transglycosylase-like domain